MIWYAPYADLAHVVTLYERLGLGVGLGLRLGLWLGLQLGLELDLS